MNCFIIFSTCIPFRQYSVKFLTLILFFFFFNDPPPTEIYTLPLHAALPISSTAASIIIVPVTTDNLTKATTGVLAAPLTLGTDFSAGLGQEALVGNTILEIKPLHPLLPSTCLSGGMFLGPNCATGTGYLVFLMDGITDFSGNHAVPDTDYASIKAALPSCAAISDATLHGICQLTSAHMLIAQGLGLNPAHIVLSFSFTTESTVDTLALISATATAQTITVHPTRLTTAAVPGPGLKGHADPDVR